MLAACAYLPTVSKHAAVQTNISLLRTKSSKCALIDVTTPIFLTLNQLLFINLNSKIMKSRILTIFIVLFSSLSFGQYQQYINMVTPYLNDSIQSGFLYFNTPNNFQPGNLYQLYRQNAPDLNNNMVLTDSHVDSLVGFTHYKYQQTYMDIPIEGAGCIEHYEPKGSLNFINAKVADSIKKSHIPKLSKEESIKYLVHQIKRKEEIVFAWEDEDWEKQIKLDKDDENATWYPEAELIWAVDTMKNMKMIISGDRYTLAYKMSVKFIEPEFETFIYYIDAQNGNILKRYTTKISDGPAHISIYGTRTIDTRWSGGLFGANAHILHTNDDLRDIHTKKDDDNKAWWRLSNSTSSSGSWAYSDRHETSAHYFASKSWDYYLQTFGRIGLDGSGDEIRIRTQMNAEGAFYEDGTTPRELIFGYNSGGKEYCLEPSVVAHEFTHGITDFTAGLSYAYESGALNESFSDIFGIVIHAKMLDGGYTDWMIGNSILSSAQEIRSLKSPKNYGNHRSNGSWIKGQPSTYNGEYWCDNCPVDAGGVHINSGVQNKWFYILANGEAELNENNDPYNVQGIGMDKAAGIAYYALTSLLQSSSQYSDSRQATIKAAKSIYGECSVEHQSTIDAWYAVGLGNENDCESLSNDDALALNEEVLIYPNPTESTLNIQVPNKIDKDILILDATGKIVDSFTSNNLVFSRNIEHLRNGVYILNFTINSNPIQKRFIIQK